MDSRIDGEAALDETTRVLGQEGVEQSPLLPKRPLETETPDTTHELQAHNSFVNSIIRAGWSSGTTCMAVAAFLFAFAAALVKVLDGNSIPVFEIVVIRSLLSMTFSGITAHARGFHPLYGQLRHWPILAMRGLVGAAAMTVFYESLLRLPLADSITILFCNPAICSVFAWLLLGEAVGWLTFTGCVASLTGVAMVARPPFIFGSSAGAHEEWNHERMVGMSLAVAGAFLTSGAYLAIRLIGKREASLTIAMWFHTSALVSNGIPLLLGYPDSPVLPSPVDWVCLLAIGCCSFSAQLLLNRGFQIQVAAKAAAVNYTQVIYAHIFGALFFQESISWLGILGAALIAVGVVTVNADTKSAPAPAKPVVAGRMQSSDVVAGGESTRSQQQGEEEGSEMYHDKHGRLKAKSSFKLPPLKFGRRQQQEEGTAGSAAGSPAGRGRLSTTMEQGLLLAEYGRHPHGDGSGVGGLQVALQPLPLQRQL